MNNPDARAKNNAQKVNSKANGTQFNQLPTPKFKSNNTQKSTAEKKNTNLQHSTMKKSSIPPLQFPKKIINPEEIKKQRRSEILNNFITILCVTLGLIIAVGSFRYLYLLTLPEKVHDIVTFYAMWLAIGITALLAGFESNNKSYVNSADGIFAFLCIIFFILCFQLGKLAIVEANSIGVTLAIFFEIFGIFLMYFPFVRRIIKAVKTF